MALIQKNALELQEDEDQVHQALKTWYMTPGIQRELRHKENGAVQAVLEVLQRRRAAQKAARS